MTENHELHRIRRKPLEPFFSRQGIDRMESMIIDETQILNDRLVALQGSKSVIRLDHVFSAFAGDVIGKICCENPPSMMRQPEFGKAWCVTQPLFYFYSILFSNRCNVGMISLSESFASFCSLCTSRNWSGKLS